MKKTPLAIIVFLLIATGLKAQHTITGVVINSVTKKPVPVVSVIVKGSSDGDFTNDHGNFKFSTSKVSEIDFFFPSFLRRLALASRK
jgi:archaellum biogenesis protein FlaJ (TadC family)